MRHIRTRRTFGERIREDAVHARGSRLARRYGLPAYWLVFALQTLDAVRDPGFVLDPASVPFPWSGVVTTWLVVGGGHGGFFGVDATAAATSTPAATTGRKVSRRSNDRGVPNPDVGVPSQRGLSMFAEHYFRDVPHIGNVAVSRHAQERAEGDGITLEDFKTTLFKGRTIPQGGSIEIRELNGIQIVIERKPTPFRGAALATTCYRMKQQAKVR